MAQNFRAGTHKIPRGAIGLIPIFSLLLFILPDPVQPPVNDVVGSGAYQYQQEMLVIPAEADAYVYYDSDDYQAADSNYGYESYLWVQNYFEVYSSVAYRTVFRNRLSYVRFRIPPDYLPRSTVITSAFIEMNMVEQTYGGVISLEVEGHQVDWNEIDWEEDGITYNQQPIYYSYVYSSTIEVDTDRNLGNWVNIADITYLSSDWIYGAGAVYTFLIHEVQNEYNGVLFSSREGGLAPRIVIYYYLLPTDTPSPTATENPTDTPSPTATETNTLTPTHTPTPTPTGTLTVRPSDTLAPTQTWTPSPSPTPTTEPSPTHVWPTVTLAPSPSATIVVIPTPPPNELDGAGYFIGTLILILIASGGIFTGLVASLLSPKPGGLSSGSVPGQPPQEPPDSPRHPHIPPILPPLRLVRIWLTHNQTGGGNLVSDSTPLVINQWYSFHIQIQVRGIQHSSERQLGKPTPLDVVLFTPETDLLLEQHITKIEIPPTGNSTMAHVAIKPLKTGRHSLRVCVYYHNVLLQSAVLDVSVASPTGVRPGIAYSANARILDYVASPTFFNLEQFSNPSVSIFTNERAGGTHWIGVYSSNPVPSEGHPIAELFVFEPYRLTQLAQIERKSLAKAQGLNKYRPNYSLPLDERSIQFFEEIMVDLATTGFDLYNELFLNDPSELGMKRLRDFDRVLRSPGLISIARCRGNATSLPWAALYTFPLISNDPRKQIFRLCEVFKHQLHTNQWTEHSILQPIQDYLDRPEACSSRPDCPLRGPTSRQTVCPFGFWGFQHLVEQPLQLVEPTPVDALPKMFQRKQYPQERELVWEAGNKLRCTVGVNPRLTNIDQVYSEIKSLVPPNLLDIEYSTDGKQILNLVIQGGRHLYYFFCHGKVDDNKFILDFSQSFISSASLYPMDIQWPDQPKPLFILNGCGTTEITPEVMHGLLEKLHLLGASGVIGTEIPVLPVLAKTIGSMLIYYLINGNSVGEAFLNLRRHLLRQGNPLGLVYTFYAPADLHIHAAGNCAWCNAHNSRHLKAGKAHG